MQMRPEVQIKSVIKALTDVILPAIDQNNQPAQEQAQLCIGLLSLMRQQLPLQFSFDCDELERLLAMSKSLSQEAASDEGMANARAELDKLTQEGDEILAGAKSSPDDLLQIIRQLRTATGEVVSLAYQQGDAATRDAVSKTVLDASKHQLLRDRALLVAQGWEADPDALPDIQTLLADQ